MPRSGRIRRYVREIVESPKAEKMAFIPPIVILITELILIIHAFILNEIFIIVLTGFLYFQCFARDLSAIQYDSRLY